MLEENHERLLIAVARKGGSANVIHLALRSGLSIRYWRRIARELQKHGYGDTYDRGRSFHINDEGVVEAKRLINEHRRAEEKAAAATANAPAAPTQDRRCKRCDTLQRPAARYCPQCGLTLQS